MSVEPGSIGRRAYEARQWGAAYESLREASAAGPLASADLQRYAMAAALTGRDDEAADLMASAHRAYLDEGEKAAAARCAFWQALAYMNRDEMAQAGGWLSRAGRLAEEAGDCAERWYVRVPEGLQLMETDPESAASLFEEIARAGDRFREADLAGLGRLGFGQSLTRQARTAEGAALFDEVMVSVVTGEVSPLVAGIVYCAVIEACTEMFDFARAQEWTDALTAWCDSQPDLVPFQGRCRVYRAEMMQLRGDWTGAIAEAANASGLLAGHPALGVALYCQGELHRLRGDLDEAEQDFQRAEERGRKPEPGLALLRLAQGRLRPAVTAIRHALDEAPRPAARAILLPAAVEILLAASEPEEAGDAANELANIAAGFDKAPIHAAAFRSLGAVALAGGDARTALEHLRRGLELWQSLDAPYEAARTHELLAEAASVGGDDETARIHRESARTTYERLGAASDLARLEMGPSGTGDLTPRELEVLRLVAAGMTNRTIANTLVISEKTAANHVSNILGKLELSSRAAATAYAYERGLV